MKTPIIASSIIWLILFSLNVISADNTIASSSTDKDSLTTSTSYIDDDEFRTTIAQIKKEQEFSKLRSERRKAILEIPKLQDRVKQLSSEIQALKEEKSEYEYYLADTNRSIESNANNDQNSTQKSEADSFILKKRDLYTSHIASITPKIAQKELDIVNAKIELEKAQEKQYELEEAINLLLIPENAKNQFKLYITAAFSLLVALVIIGFFIVSLKDEQVRRSIFSSQSGIQFLTLFSLVIAIILFGITGILGGKELAALLGGISGYILGRVTDSRPSN